MAVRRILLALFVLLFTGNFTLNAVQMDTWAQAVVFQLKKEMTDDESSKGEFSPLEDGFVQPCLTTDDSKSKALRSHLLWPLRFIEIRHAPTYLIDTCFRC